jgi:hypothetical protein
MTSVRSRGRAKLGVGNSRVVGLSGVWSKGAGRSSPGGLPVPGGRGQAGGLEGCVPRSKPLPHVGAVRVAGGGAIPVTGLWGPTMRCRPRLQSGDHLLPRPSQPVRPGPQACRVQGGVPATKAPRDESSIGVIRRAREPVACPRSPVHGGPLPKRVEYRPVRPTHGFSVQRQGSGLENRVGPRSEQAPCARSARVTRCAAGPLRAARRLPVVRERPVADGHDHVLGAPGAVGAGREPSRADVRVPAAEEAADCPHARQAVHLLLDRRNASLRGDVPAQGPHRLFS